jgi:AAA family ATP:ADP antiporter
VEGTPTVNEEEALEDRASAGTRLLQRVVDVRPNEVRALFLSCLYYFLLLTSYYILRPIRDEMGVAGGVQNLQWLFTGTLIGMLLANPPFAALVRKYPRRVFIPIVYRFFMVNLLVFFALLRMMPEANIWIGRIFFIWTSVFNLFVISVMWSFMADLFRSEQGKRLFAFIALGGTIGAIAGSSITAFLAGYLGPVNLLLVSIFFLESSVWCAHALGGQVRHPARPREAGPSEAAASDPAEERAIGGGVLAGIKHVFHSQYLLGICLFMLLFTIGSTFLYFQQGAIIDAAIPDRAQRTAVFARIDLAVNILTLGGQLFLTGRLLRWFGVAATLAILPALSVMGFLGLGFMPMLGMVIAFQVLRRAGNFAVARPTREVLFTVVSREDKYKAKNFIDTVVYRGGDQVGAWSYAAMAWLGLGVGGISFVAAPLSLVWFFIAVWLGRQQARRAAATLQDDMLAA